MTLQVKEQSVIYIHAFMLQSSTFDQDFTKIISSKFKVDEQNIIRQ